MTSDPCADLARYGAIFLNARELHIVAEGAIAIGVELNERAEIVREGDQAPLREREHAMPSQLPHFIAPGPGAHLPQQFDGGALTRGLEVGFTPAVEEPVVLRALF